MLCRVAPEPALIPHRPPDPELLCSVPHAGHVLGSTCTSATPPTAAHASSRPRCHALRCCGFSAKRERKGKITTEAENQCRALYLCE
eukprot:3183682-Rhodomonas_salina.2